MISANLKTRAALAAGIMLGGMTIADAASGVKWGSARKYAVILASGSDSVGVSCSRLRIFSYRVGVARRRHRILL